MFTRSKCARTNSTRKKNKNSTLVEYEVKDGSESKRILEQIKIRRLYQQKAQELDQGIHFTRSKNDFAPTKRRSSPTYSTTSASTRGRTTSPFLPKKRKRASSIPKDNRRLHQKRRRHTSIKGAEHKKQNLTESFCDLQKVRHTKKKTKNGGRLSGAIENNSARRCPIGPRSGRYFREFSKRLLKKCPQPSFPGRPPCRSNEPWRGTRTQASRSQT